MRSLFLFGLAFGSSLLGGAGRPAAQAPEARHPATDTLQPANPRYYLPVSRISTTGGQLLYVFIAPGRDRGTGVGFTWRNPMTLPRPRPVFIKMDQVKWTRTGGVYYEPVGVGGPVPYMLAPRILAGPRVELFDVATPKKGVPVPVPGGLIWTGAFSNKYHHAWYLRHPGAAAMTPVPEGKKFAPFLADYLADAPELAAAIRAGAEGHRYDDVPRLLETYNRPAPAGGAPR